MAKELGQNSSQNTGKQALPLRRGLIRNLPSLPQPTGPQGITFSRFALCMGGAVVLAALGWAYFMGYMVGRGDNPREQVEEATSFLRPNHEAQGDKGTEAAQRPSGTGQTSPTAGQEPLGQSGQIGQSAQGQSGQAAQQAAPIPQVAPGFDPHARPQGEGLAAWGKQQQTAPATPAVAAPVTRQAQPAPARVQTPPVPKEPKYTFTYQLAAFRDKPAAEALQKKLAAKGRKSIVSKSGKVFLVTFRVRGTEDEARSVRQSLERQGLGKALLLSRKPI